MTALAATRDTRAIGGPINPSALSTLNFPVAAATTIFAGAMVATDAAGNAVPASSAVALKVWGRAEKTVINTVAAGFGSAGQLTIEVLPGVTSWTNGAGADAITAAHVGRIAYASDDNTVNLTDGGGTRPAAGKIYGLDGTQVKVDLGAPSLWDESDILGGVVHVKVLRARNVVNGNVANLAAYTVASGAGTNDSTLGVENDVVLLVAQTTGTENGLYVIGPVAAGLAALTRVAEMPSGFTILSDEYDVDVASGTVYAHTRWFNTAGVVIGTTDPAFFPERVNISQALVAGTMTITSIPILSVTKTAFVLTRRIANTSTLTVGGYCTTVGGASGVTAGKLGTASLIIEACVGAGTINNADISTLNLCVSNR